MPPGKDKLTSHELARLLLELPDLPIATHANNHTFVADSSRQLVVALMQRGLDFPREFILIGNPYRTRINFPNEFLTKVYTDHVLPES